MKEKRAPEKLYNVDIPKTIRNLEYVKGEKVPDDMVKVIEDTNRFQSGAGCKPLDPVNGAMSETRRAWRELIYGKIRKYDGDIKALMQTDEGHFIEIIEAARRFAKGLPVGVYRQPVHEKYSNGSIEDIDGYVSTDNSYLKLLFMASEEERSFNRMCKNMGMHPRRVTVLKQYFDFVDRDGSYIKTSKAGQEFLQTLMPYFGKEKRVDHLHKPLLHFQGT